jgi:biotin carboxyl carrier protein
MKEKELKLEINGKEYQVAISSFTSDHAEISVNGTKYEVGLKDLGIEEVSEIKPQPLPRPEEDKLHRPAGAPPAGAKKRPATTPVFRPKSLGDNSTITAPLPGLIKKFYVREGDVITPGQPVMIIEAMKMENEINASTGGMIIDIRFNEGDAVNQGDVIFYLKPAEA